MPWNRGDRRSDAAKGAGEIAGQGLRVAKNFLDGGFGDRAAAAYGNGEYGWAATYTLAGTAYGVANGLTLGEAGGISKFLTTSLTKLESLFTSNALSKGPGAFMSVSESMSAQAAAYQARVAGTNAGSAYVVNGVKFDGFAKGVLIDAKSNYAQFVKDGQFRSWFSGADSLVAQAQRQLSAAGGTPIQWRFAEEAAANATRALFQQRGISGISIVHVP